MKKQRRRKRVIQVYAGWQTPQVQFQIMPLQWGLAFTISRNCGGFQLGPFSVMAYWAAVSWEQTYRNDFRRVDK